jgi:hypothetical protein
MARAKDKQKLERLKDEIDALKHRGIDHQHPKFQEWKKEATSTLKAMYGSGSPLLMKLEEIGSRRREDRMWEEEHDIRGRGKAAFKQDLERAREILDEALEVSHLLGEDGAGIGEEEFISTVSKKEAIPADRETPSETPVETPPETPVVETPPETPKKAPSEKPAATLPETPPAKPAEAPPQTPPETPPAKPPETPPTTLPATPPQVLPEPPPQVPIAEVGERRREEDIAELLHELEKDKKDLEKVQATLEEALEGISAPSEEDRLEELIEQLEEQIKDPNVLMRKVQKTMEELLRVKGKKALLQRLTQETRDPKVPWGKIRGLMKGVWEIDRKFLVDILPDLLKD